MTLTSGDRVGRIAASLDSAAEALASVAPTDEQMGCVGYVDEAFFRVLSSMLDALRLQLDELRELRTMQRGGPHAAT